MTDAAAAAPAWDAVGAASFVLLGTYRRSGERVDTVVWIARDRDALVVTTEVHTGKVKRLRRDPRVRLQPSGRLGKVEPGAPVAEGVAEIVESGPEFDAAHRALARTYGWQFRAFLGVERFVRRVRKQDGRRVILRITRG